MTTFIPDHTALDSEKKVPFFEDSAAAGVAGRGTEKTVTRLLAEVNGWIVKLGGFQPMVAPGKFPHITDAGHKINRYGLQFTFIVNGTKARIDCAALPIRKETEIKKDRALAQALYLLRDKLQADYYNWIYSPGAIPLLPYLLGPSGKTVTESIRESGVLGLGDGT